MVSVVCKFSLQGDVEHDRMKINLPCVIGFFILKDVNSRSVIMLSVIITIFLANDC